MRRRASAPATALACALASCSTGRIHEIYHFPGKRGSETVNYYRVEVTGSAWGTELRYLSGLFDEDALNRYFNTFAQPNGGALLQPASGQTTGSKSMQNEVKDPPKPATDEKRDPDPSALGRKLVLLLSQNSEVVAEQIGDIAQSEAFATIVGRVVFADQLAAAEAERNTADLAERYLAASKREAADLAPLLDDELNTQAELLRFVNDVAAQLGVKTPFKTFKDAELWLSSNRASLIGGAR